MDVPPGSAPSRWLDKADADAEVARDLLELGHHEAAAFYAQQSAEKALKAVQIQRQRTFDKTHDLRMLARTLKAGERLETAAAFLSQFYTTTRYPDAGGGVSEEEARTAVRTAKEVCSWARTQRS